MIQKNEPISSKNFSKGLVTRTDLIKPDTEQSPNCMDVKWFFDGSIGKRMGSSTTNTIFIGSTAAAGWTINSTGTLSTGLQSYWKLDEASGGRSDAFDSNPLTDQNATGNIVGIRNGAALFALAQSNALYKTTISSLETGNVNFSISSWVFFNSTGAQIILSKRGNAVGNFEYQLFKDAGNNILFGVSSDGSSFTSVTNTSFGTVTTGTWINIVAWHSNNSHIGVSINLSTTTAPYTGGVRIGSAPFILGATDTGNSADFLWLDARLDEVGFWKKVLTSGERRDLFGGSTGNTFSGGASAFGWAMFDFGASSIRWLTIAAGTGIVASSNLGTTFVTVATSRTQTYQYFERSKNVLIATSDAYDPTLFWAGSATTFASVLAINSAPQAKYSINYQGFLILLNYMNSNGAISPRGFAYADENLQLTDSWTNHFDFPSSADDEVTAAFILNKFLYVSTRYKIFRVAFVGGNPDWSFLKVKDYGYVPRTVKIMTLKGSTVAVGMDWNRRIRVFDGFDDLFISDNVETDNNYCSFAMEKISFAGSGLLYSHAEFDQIEQEYRLNLTIGANSTNTTHAIVINGRTLAVYPYQNQLYQAMCVAESNNQQHLMAVDRSGFVHILNSGNLDVSNPINDVYDSPILFPDSPLQVSKAQQLNFFFSVKSSGTIYHQDCLNLSSTFSPIKPLRDRDGNTQITGSEKFLQILRTVDVPATYNTYQFRLTSSSNTATPWELSRWDLVQKAGGLGMGR